MALVARLTDHFGLSLATLVGEDPTADDEDAQIRPFRQAKKLTPNELALLDERMQSLLKRRRKAGWSGN
jgi:hypothetical protein